MRINGLILCGILILFCASVTEASSFEYSLTSRIGYGTLSGGPANSAKFTGHTFWGAALGYRISNRWKTELDVSFHTNYTDSTASSSFTISGSDNATQKWEATRVALTFSRYLSNPDRRFSLYGGLGLGLSAWEIKDPVGDTVISVIGVRQETVDFATTELLVTSQVGIDLNITPKWAFDLRFRADYLTGAGAEFADNIKSDRNRWQFDVSLGLSFLIGNLLNRSEWRSDDEWPAYADSPTRIVSRRESLDADVDGVPDKDDNCPDTPVGAVVDNKGCPIDTDGDGISDGLDDCPNTDNRAYGKVDIYGCPVDSDFDGIPDYIDACPNNPVGAHIDNSGCPQDTDKDGVFDGLDDCPNTLVGVEVDKFGCIDLSFLSKPMVLNIDYPSGSFEIDPYSREKLKKLARVLVFLNEIRMDINGYTDNIGTTVANQKLSEKRARRVYDYLATQGIDTNRMNVNGRGEVNFVASNDTAEGRAKNRRIEIIFYK